MTILDLFSVGLLIFRRILEEFRGNSGLAKLVGELEAAIRAIEGLRGQVETLAETESVRVKRLF